MDVCDHGIVEVQTAVADGLCPLCLWVENGQLKEIINEIEVRTCAELDSMFKESPIGIPITLITVNPKTVLKIKVLKTGL